MDIYKWGCMGGPIYQCDWVKGQLHRWSDRKMSGWIGADGWMDRPRDVWIDRWSDEWMEA